MPDERDQSDSSFPAGAGHQFPQRAASLRRQMPEILENANEALSTAMRRLLDFLWQEWKGLQFADREPERPARTDCQQ